MNFTNKTYIITGAASGLGRAVSVELSKFGANLVLLDLNSSGLEETKKICRQNACVTLLAIDITDFDAIKRAFSENDWGGGIRFCSLCRDSLHSPYKDFVL